MAHNIDVIQAIVSSVYPSKGSYTDQEIHLAKTLQEQKSNIDSGRLAIGYLWEKFNESCSPELHLKNSRVMGSLIRSCNLTVSGGKHNANGKRAVICLEWDKNTDTYIETCLQCLQCLQKHEGQGFQVADVEKSMSAMSALNWDDNANLQTLQTTKSRRLPGDNAASKGDADKADIADVFVGPLENNSQDEVII
jgi:hypothetical protein